MLNSKLYKQYYPLRNVSDVGLMSQHDRKILIKWLLRIEKEIEIYNLESSRRACKNGLRFCHAIYLTYTGDIPSLAEKIKDCFCEINESDIEFLNDVIYRHKYIEIISMFWFPIR